MKNFIFLNYNINVEKIYTAEEKNYFFIDDTKIYIKEYNNDIKLLDTLVELTNKLYYSNLNVYTFLLNNENKYYTKKDNKYISLLKVNSYENDININDLIKFHNIKSDLPDYNIINIWKDEIDEIETKMVEFNTEYQLIQSSINYFIGLAENAISLMSNYEQNIIEQNNSIGHKFNYKMYKSCKMGDPFIFIKVNKMYDLANYIKYNFYIKNINYDDINYIINEIGNTEYEKVYFFANLLYPNVYFDLIRNILLGNEREEKLNLFLNNIKNYKNLLLNCQNMIKNVKLIKLITWLGD